MSLLVGVLLSYAEVRINNCNRYEKTKSCLKPLFLDIDETKFAKDFKSAGMDIVYPKSINIGQCREGCNVSRSGNRGEVLRRDRVGINRPEGENDRNCCVPIEYKDFNVLIFQEDMNGTQSVKRKAIKGIMVSKCGHV